MAEVPLAVVVAAGGTVIDEAALHHLRALALAV
jgi:hypothetical protein